MEFRVLGSMEVVHDGDQVRLGGSQRRAMLGFLLLQANRTVAASRLLNALWDEDEAPRTARKILQNAVHALRGVLASASDGSSGAARLLTRSPGYMLQVAPERIDLHVFQKWVAQAREKKAQGAPEEAAELLRDALALWRGPALADLVEVGFEWPELVTVQNSRLDVLEDYFDTQLTLGRHHTVLAELETTVQAEPLRERLCGQLMLALYRCGRQADALSTYSRVRNLLVEDLGLVPGQPLQRLQQAILTQDPALSLRTGPGPVAGLTVAGLTGDQPRKAVAVSAPAAAGNGGRAARPAAGPAPRGPEGRSPDATADRGTERRWVSVVALRTQFVPPPGEVSGEGLEDLLDDAASVVGEQIARFGGTVTASLGSVSLALFGIGSSAAEDHVRQAVSAALAVRDTFGSRSASAAGAAGLTVHAYVDTGEVLLRHSTKSDVPIVIGTVLDESQPMLFDVPAGEVRVSDAVRRLTEDAVAYRSSGSTAAPWQAIGTRQVLARGGGVLAADQSSEADVLCALAERTRHRSVPHLVTVVGGAGTGKSRLLGEFARRMAGQPVPVRVLSAAVAPDDGPARVQARLFSLYCGVRPGDDTLTARAAVTRRTEALVRSERTARWLLSRLLPLVDPALAPAPADEVLDAWHEFFHRAARGEPLVLCVDDLHRAGDAVIDAIAGLAGNTAPVPLFVVATARPELLLRRPAWSGGLAHATTVTLGPSERTGTERSMGIPVAAARGEHAQRVGGQGR
ncbi:BTAD domain-containing putative transcriptional regulator [Streptomyces sp. SudanB182_2057]|uniref:BTAD domain-containing putative transcriptional regulator n=1 Tax=Streptomyces sp. SudanB182_2057 TaxID=3035281 RepID=UPI003F579D03